MSMTNEEARAKFIRLCEEAEMPPHDALELLGSEGTIWGPVVSESGAIMACRQASPESHSVAIIVSALGRETYASFHLNGIMMDEQQALAELEALAEKIIARRARK